MISRIQLSYIARFLIIVVLALGVLGAQPTQTVFASATLTVTNTNDSGPGSLRQAIVSAVAGDSIVFAASLSGKTITVASTLVIDKSLTIDGSSLASRISISGNNSVRVFDVSKADITVTLDSLRVVNGLISTSEGGGLGNKGTLTIKNSIFSTNSAGEGGAIINRGTLTISVTSFTGNIAIDSGGAIANYGTLTINNGTFANNIINGHGQGGAIYNDGPLSISNSTFTGNHAYDGGALYDNPGSTADITTSMFSDNSAEYGGGILNYIGTLSITNSTIRANTGSSQGAGIHNAGTLFLTDSTVSENNANQPNTFSSGGGIYNTGKMTAIGSLFWKNTATGDGGGIYNSSSLTILNSTFSENTASDTGGGLYNSGTSDITNITISGSFVGTYPFASGIHNAGMMNFSNSILANSSSGSNCYNDASTGIIGLNTSNLIESNAAAPNSCGTSSLSSDPKLGSLADNGGPTQTMALLPGSPALDAGDDAACAIADQRSVGRPQGSHCDIGAYEFVRSGTVTLNVTKTADTNDGICDTDCSLREAIANSYNGDTIKFGVSGTIVFGSALPPINKTLVIDGSGQTIALDGAKKYRIFNVGEIGDLTVKNLAFQNGKPMTPCEYDTEAISSCGGAIYADGTLTVVDSTFSGNSASLGGAIAVMLGTANIEGSTFENNSSAGSGGAVFNLVGSVNVENSTFYGNSAGDWGGGVLNDIGALTLTNNTFANNSASLGAGIYNSAGGLAFTNNILANSTTGSDCYNESPYGEISLNVNNLIEANAPSPNNCGVPLFAVDPRLGVLANNGGFTQTMALLPGSPAIDTGDDGSCPPTDQRGVTRPQSSHCDLGAYEQSLTFADVPFDYWSWEYIQRLYGAGVTSGCSTNPMMYCPTTTVTRDQMAVFLLRGKHGSSYSPPTPTGIFQDVPPNHWAAAWIEQLAVEGITSGCSVSPKHYCPTTPVTRDQMAVFLLRAKHGSDYVPPKATGIFLDAPPGYWAADWIEQLAAEGITSGCSVSPKLYCPTTPVTRDQMAVFLVRNFGLAAP
jgi:CSLREA domain-containing protein